MQKCCNGVIKECCTDLDCPGDPSLCVSGKCNNGTCGFHLNCQAPSLCCSFEICEPCGGGGFGGFGGFQQ
jgi:hypothetical protein